MCADDPSVDDATLLYRRVHPRFVVPDSNRGCMRLASGAFQSEEMSVALGDMLIEIGLTPDSIVEGYDDYALIAFPAAAARAAQQAVCRDALDNDPAHGLVVGKKTGSRQRQLCRASTWVVAPPDACDPPAV